MRYTKETIKKGVFLTGSPCPGGFDAATITKEHCETYTALQAPPSVSLDEIKAPIQAATEKVAALRASLQARK